MTQTTDSRADSTRQQILRAAARQYARRPYHQVGLDEILAEAELTKGAMYFHFRSKHAMALAVIDDQYARSSAAVADLLARKLSGLETLIDLSYQLAVRDISEDLSRAALHLLESIGRIDGLQSKSLAAWIDTVALTVRQAIVEGDVFEERDPHDVGRLLVSTYMGLRRVSDLDEPERFLRQLEKVWAVALPGLVRPERIDYFRQFIRRRTTIAIGSTTALAGST
ncbi:MAG TPA: TetR/AcrR family transcriptional regulator [Mycobacterium sp.]|uniref:TetR/AcrR family transcriptional regulator n=1 Tax=Mycobacterium sp. TaxID=1785 RepID=UPI002F41CB7A